MLPELVYLSEGISDRLSVQMEKAALMGGPSSVMMNGGALRSTANLSYGAGATHSVF